MEIIQNIVIFGIVISLLVTFIGFCTVKYSLSGLNNINTALQDFVEGDGDLTQRLYEGRNNEVGQVAHRFNIFVNQLQMFMSNLDRVVEDLTVKAASLNSDSQKGQTSLTAQQSELESISTALNQMQISILQVAEGASLPASTITESLKQAKYGEQATIRSNSAISSLAEEISKSVDKIGHLTTIHLVLAKS
ncbi:methyl-accepting chemotaxis protein [Vibrio astriarenae]|nr:methyl-accepting chemotaxis protein [Vibrio sp. C7]